MDGTAMGWAQKNYSWGAKLVSVFSVLQVCKRNKPEGKIPAKTEAPFKET